MSKRVLLAALAVTAALLVLTGCGGKPPSPQPSPSSGIHGILLFAGGPYVDASPSPLPGGFGTTELGRPYYGATILARVKWGGDTVLRAMASAKPSADGLFTISLPPGTYVLTPKVPKDGPWPMSTTVVVNPGEFTRVRVYVSGP